MVALIHTKKTAHFKNDLSAGVDERAVVARISTISIDRDGEVLLPSGIDTREFKKNPVVLFSHDSRTIPVGTATKIEKSHDAIRARMTFAERPASHPEGVEWLPDTLLSLFQQKVLRAFSVGFIPIDMRMADDKDKERFGEKVEAVITKWKLLEFSIVAVPANQDALVEAVSKGIDIGQDISKRWDIRRKRRTLILTPDPLRVLDIG